MCRQKSPSTRRCIKTKNAQHETSRSSCQKAPSTRRCIETVVMTSLLRGTRVRKHLAPEGALRHLPIRHGRRDCSCQKAPRTRRCIETLLEPRPVRRSRGQKAPSTRRCIETVSDVVGVSGDCGQKAPSTRRCIKTLSAGRIVHPSRGRLKSHLCDDRSRVCR